LVLDQRGHTVGRARHSRLNVCGLLRTKTGNIPTVSATVCGSTLDTLFEGEYSYGVESARSADRTLDYLVRGKDGEYCWGVSYGLRIDTRSPLQYSYGVKSARSADRTLDYLVRGKDGEYSYGVSYGLRIDTRSPLPREGEYSYGIEQRPVFGSTLDYLVRGHSLTNRVARSTLRSPVPARDWKASAYDL
jgi:hypothetical protein